MSPGIAFTYDIETTIGQTRLYAGDTDGEGLNRTGGDRTRTDAEIGFLLAQNDGDPRAAAAELLEARAAEYAQQAAKTSQGSVGQDYTQRSTKCLEAAKALRDGGDRRPIQSTPDSRPFTIGTPENPGSMDMW